MPKEKHDEAFWRNIIALNKDGKSVSFLMSEYGITRSSFYYYRRRFQDEENGSLSEEDKDKKLARLEKEKAKLELENEILKKAVLIIGEK